MIAWVVDSQVGVGQALDPNATDDPARVVSYTQKWGVPTPLVAPKFNGTFWFWELAPVAEWEPKLGYASSLRDAQALTTWNKSESTVLYGDFIRNPPYVFQSAFPGAPAPQPTPAPAPAPAPTKPTAPPAKSHDVLKTNLIVGAAIAAIVAAAWYVT